MAMALIISNIQMGVFAIINEKNNSTMAEQSINEETIAVDEKEVKPGIEILNDAGRSIKADSAKFRLTENTSLKVKMKIKNEPTILTLKIPYYYKFTDDIKDSKIYTVLSIDDVSSFKNTADSSIMSNYIVMEVHGQKEMGKEISIVLPIELNKDALSKSAKNKEILSEEGRKDAADKSAGSPENTVEVKSENIAEEKAAVSSENRETIKEKSEKKSEEKSDSANYENSAEKKSETSFIMTVEPGRGNSEPDKEEKTVTIPWLEPKEIQIDKSDLDKEDSDKKETALSEVQGAVKEEKETDIKDITGLIDNNDLADIIGEKADSSSEKSEADKTSEETVVSGSRSSSKKTDSTSSRKEKTENSSEEDSTETDKNSKENSSEKDKAETDENKSKADQNSKTDKNSKSDKDSEESGKDSAQTERENSTEKGSAEDENKKENTIIGKNETEDKENGIPILKPEEIKPGDVPLADSEADAQDFLNKITEAGVNPTENIEETVADSGNHPERMVLTVMNTRKEEESMKNYVLGEHKGGVIHVDVIAEKNRTAPTVLTFTIPDYYSFDPAVKNISASNYKFVSLESDKSKNKHAENNKLVIELDLGNPNDPPKIKVDFSYNLNKDSISEEDFTKWQEGKWNPKDGNCKFSVAANGITDENDKNNVKTYTADITTREYKGIGVANGVIAPIETGDIPDFSQPSEIYEHGVARNISPFNMGIYYELPDKWINGPVGCEKVDIYAPEGFYFLKYKKSNLNLGSYYKNISDKSVCTMTEIDGKNRKATIQWEDDGSDKHYKRYAGDLAVVPDEQYWTTDNKPGSTIFPPESIHGFKNDVYLKLEGEENKISRVYNYKVADYEISDRNEMSAIGKILEGDSEVLLNGKKTSSKGMLILQEASSGETRTVGRQPDGTDDVNYHFSSVVSYSNNIQDEGSEYDKTQEPDSQGNYPLVRHPRRIPETDGAGTVLTVEFPDKNFKVEEFSLGQRKGDNLYDGPTRSWSANLAESKIEKIVYYTDGDSSGKTINIPADDYSGIAFNSQKYCNGERLSKIKVYYSKFTYINSGIAGCKYTVDPKTADGSVLPINYTYEYKDKNSQTKTLKDTNYILINNKKCPEWYMWGFDTADGVIPSGKMYDGETGYNDNKEFVYKSQSGKDCPENGTKGLYGFFLGYSNQKIGVLKNPETGKVVEDTGYIDKLKNPTFSTFLPYESLPSGFPVTGVERAPVYYFTNGKIYMNKNIKDGWKGWSVELVTCSSEEYRNGKNLRYLKDIKYRGKYEENKNPDKYVWDLYEDGTIKDKRQIIIGARFSYDGTLDISPLSDKWNGEKTEKYLFRFGIDKLARDPFSGLYIGDRYSANGEFHPTLILGSLYYENCAGTNKEHIRKVDGIKVGKNLTYGYGRNSSRWRGAELLIPENMTTELKGILKQDARTTLTAEISMTASKTGDAKLVTGLGETFYFKIEKQRYSHFVIGSAKVDGEPVDAEEIEMNGSKYVKIVNKIKTPKIKKEEKIGGIYKFEPWRVSMDFFTIPTAPTDSRGYPLVSENGNWIDLREEQVAEINGKRYAIQPNRTSQGIFGEYRRYAESNPFIKDDPMGLYEEKPTSPDKKFEPPEHHWALPFKGFSEIPREDEVEYLTLRPGVSEVYEKSEKEVYPNEEYNLTSGLAIIAPEEDLNTFISEIKIPRKGDVSELPNLGHKGTSGPVHEASVSRANLPKMRSRRSTVDYDSLKMAGASGTDEQEVEANNKGSIIGDGTSSDGVSRKFTTNVNLYLKGPVEPVDRLKDKGSGELKFTYSMSPGDTAPENRVYVDESQISDWTKVNFIKIEDNIIKARDKCFYIIPMRTEATLEDGENYTKGTSDGGALYCAFVEGYFKSDGIEKQNRRLNAYVFEPFEISGKIWNDKNADGNKGMYNDKGVEKPEEYINLQKSGKGVIDMQITRNGKLVDSIYREKNRPDVAVGIDESKYIQNNEMGSDGSYKFYTNQFKDITYQIKLNDAGLYRNSITKYGENTQNIFQEVAGTNTAVAQRIIPENSTIGKKVKNADAGIKVESLIPDTGGIGELVFYVAGVLVMAIGYITARKMIRM